MSRFFEQLEISKTIGTCIALGLLSHAFFKRFEPPLFPTLPIFLLSTAISPFALSLSWTTAVGFSWIPDISTLGRSFLVSALLHLLYLATVFTSISVYRLGPWHPLAKFPGPWQAKLTKFWGVSITVPGRDHILISQLHNKYGDFVRIGPNELSIRNVNAIPTIYGTGGFIKGPFYDAFMRPKGAKPMFVLRSHSDHAARRRIYDRGFTPLALRNYLEAMVPEVQDYIEELGKRADGAKTNKKIGEGRHGEGLSGVKKEREGNIVDMNAWMGFFTFDFMGQLLFGRSFNLKHQGDSFGMWSILEAAMTMFIIFGNVPWLTPIVRVLPVSHDQRRFQDKAIELVTARKLEGAKHKDLFYYLMGEDRDAEVGELHPFTVMAELNNMMIAGSDTTSAGLVFTLYYLLKNPDVQRELQDELATIISPDDPYPFDDHDKLFDSLSKLPYLNGCLSEAMRLVPPVPVGMQRMSPSTGAKVAGTFIPGNTQVSVPIYAIHRDERCFAPYPLEYKPERWYAKEYTTNKTANLTFMYGPYGCVGRHLAGHEERVVLSALLHHFEFAFAPDFEEEVYPSTVRETFGLVKTDLPLVIKRRKQSP